MYAGLRRGELRALRWEDVDLGGNIIHVQRSWDPIEGAQETKTDAERKVPIASILRDYLVEHRIRATDPNGLVFGEGEEPFSLNTIRNRALRAWDEVGLEPITPHEARHTYASTMIAAGVNAKAISEFMAHRRSRSPMTPMGISCRGTRRRPQAYRTPTSRASRREAGASTGARLLRFP